ncbi:PAAR domain-containing protein [Janthinobacterium sp. RB2R34]|uniref:PAAR domain-containing protein n=1 Tax=Janthinobacterium sp. RB2R34 TaxID=3424193 RepID=UPI003F266699
MRKIIRLGDTTSHGGKVLSCAATHVTVGGIAVACVGDLCSCPLKGHNGCTIASGSARHAINGLAVAFEGDRTSCGATLMAGGATYRTS